MRLAGRVDGVVPVVDRLAYEVDDSKHQPTERALEGITGEWIRKL